MRKVLIISVLLALGLNGFELHAQKSCYPLEQIRKEEVAWVNINGYRISGLTWELIGEVDSHGDTIAPILKSKIFAPIKYAEEHIKVHEHEIELVQYDEYGEILSSNQTELNDSIRVNRLLGYINKGLLLNFLQGDFHYMNFSGDTVEIVNHRISISSNKEFVSLRPNDIHYQKLLSGYIKQLTHGDIVIIDWFEIDPNFRESKWFMFNLSAYWIIK